MTFFSFTVTVPKNTPKSAPVEQELPLTPGIVHRVRIRFPPGSKGKLHLKIMHGAHQFAPTNRDGDFIGNDEWIEWKEWYELVEHDTLMRAVAWNESTAYAHSVIVQLAVLPAEILNPMLTGAKRQRTVAWYRWFHGDCCGTVYHNDSTVCTASEEIFIYANGEESDREEEKEVI